MRRTGSRGLRPFTGWDLALFAGPAALLVGVLYLLPFLLNAGLSLFSWSAFRSGLEWVGFDNYTRLNQSGLIWPTVGRTMVYTVISAGAMLASALTLAFAVESDTRSNRILRTAFFAPIVLSPLAVGFVFRALLGLNGTVNSGLTALFGAPISIAWLGSTNLSLIVVSLVTAWRWFPVIFVVFLAGLAAIPQDLVDASRVDGAGRFGVIRHVKLPLLAPALTFGVVIAIITSLNVYETIVVLTNGGPGRSTEVLNFLILEEFGEGRFASAAALSTVLYGCLVLMTAPLVAFLRRREVRL